MGSGSFPHVGFDVTRVYTSLGPSTTAASVGVGNQAPKLGEVYHDEATGAVFKFVKNTHSTAFSVGDVGVYDISGGLFTSVKKGATAALNLLAGVWMGTPAAAGYGWIQVRGYNDTVNVEGTVAIVLGDSLKAVNSQFYAVHDAAAGTESAYSRHIVALTAYSTAATSSIAGYINCF